MRTEQIADPEAAGMQQLPQQPREAPPTVPWQPGGSVKCCECKFLWYAMHPLWYQIHQMYETDGSKPFCAASPPIDYNRACAMLDDHAAICMSLIL